MMTKITVSKECVVLAEEMRPRSGGQIGQEYRLETELQKERTRAASESGTEAKIRSGQGPPGEAAGNIMQQRQQEHGDQAEAETRTMNETS